MMTKAGPCSLIFPGDQESQAASLAPSSFADVPCPSYWGGGQSQDKLGPPQPFLHDQPPVPGSCSEIVPTRLFVGDRGRFAFQVNERDGLQEGLPSCGLGAGRKASRTCTAEMPFVCSACPSQRRSRTNRVRRPLSGEALSMVGPSPPAVLVDLRPASRWDGGLGSSIVCCPPPPPPQEPLVFMAAWPGGRKP